MTDPYDTPLSALRDRVDDLGVSLGIWCNRAEPDAHARRAASAAVDTIDAAIGHLHAIRQLLLTEIRTSDEATAARADALLRNQEER